MSDSEDDAYEFDQSDEDDYNIESEEEKVGNKIFTTKMTERSLSDYSPRNHQKRQQKRQLHQKQRKRRSLKLLNQKQKL
jgi:hypothetical protein